MGLQAILRNAQTMLEALVARTEAVQGRCGDLDDAVRARRERIENGLGDLASIERDARQLENLIEMVSAEPADGQDERKPGMEGLFATGAGHTE